jgi:O-antigen ligase/capsular polysaccharide biosynthesis protein
MHRWLGDPSMDGLVKGEGRGTLAVGPGEPDVLAAVWRQRWTIAAVAIVAALAGVFLALRAPERYEATTTIVVVPRSDSIEPFAVLKRLEYQSDARLVDTAGEIANREDIVDTAADNLGVSSDGYSSTANFNDGAHTVQISVKGPSLAQAASLADEIGRMTMTEFVEGYPDFSVQVIDRTTSELWSAGSPRYVLPVSLAVIAALTAYVIVILRRRGTRPDRSADASTSRLVPVLNRGPWPRNILIAGGVGATAGVIAAGSGAAVFTIAAIAVGLGIAAAMLRPEWALVGLIAMMTMRLAENANDFYGIPLATIPVVGLLVGVLILRRLVWGERPRGVAVALGAVSLIAIASLVSVFNAKYPESSVDPIVELVKSAVVLLLVVLLINSARDFRLAIWTLIVLGGVVAALSVFQYLTGSFEQSFFGLAQARFMNIAFDYDDFRITGPFGDPNFFGQALVPIFAIAVERAWHESNLRLRVVAAVSAVVVPMAIVFTFSRGALLALGVVGIAMLFVLRPSAKTIAVGVAVLVVLAALLPRDYVTRATALFEDNETADVVTDPSVDQRSSVILSGLQMFFDYPLTGVGTGNFPDHYLEYAERTGLAHDRASIEPHSFYVEIAAETGLVGLAAWGIVGLIVFETFRAARRKLRWVGADDLQHMVTAFAIGLVGFYTSSLFLHQAFARYMWVLLGISFALPKVVDSVIQSEHTPITAP